MVNFTLNEQKAKVKISLLIDEDILNSIDVLAFREAKKRNTLIREILAGYVGAVEK